MKKLLAVSILSILTIGLLFCAEESAPERAAVEDTIVKAYVEGVFINRDTEAMKKGFHPEFSKADYHDGHTHAYNLTQWCADIDRLKANSGKSEAKITHKFPMVDITGHAAVAKVEIYKDGKLIITDYMSLYKLDGSWKIMNKISISPS